MFPGGSGPLPDDVKDLTRLLQTFQDQDGSINPDKAPPDMKDLLQRLQDVQQSARTARSPQAVTITPEPGFVVKTVDNEGRKVFINVCGSPQVAPPGDWQQGQVAERVRDALERAAHEDVSETLRFPLSMGSFREDHDHAGGACHVLDVVLNLDVLKQAQAFRPLKLFLIELAMAWAGQKHAVALDPAYKLPRLRYKGGAVQPQHLRLDRSPMVKEVGDVQEPPSFALKLEKPRTAPSKAASIKGSAPKVPERQAAPSSAAAQVEVPAAEPPQPAQQHSAEAAAAPPSEVQTRGAQPQDSGPQAAAEGADKGKAPAKAGCAAAEASAPLAAEQAPPKPSHDLAQLEHSVHFVGRPVEAVEVSVSMGAAAAASSSQDHLSVEVGGDQVFVSAPGYRQLVVALPFGVDACAASAQLAEDGAELLLRLPFKPYRTCVEEAKLEMQRRREHLFLDSPLMELDV